MRLNLQRVNELSQNPNFSFIGLSLEEMLRNGVIIDDYYTLLPFPANSLQDGALRPQILPDIMQNLNNGLNYALDLKANNQKDFAPRHFSLIDEIKIVYIECIHAIEKHKITVKNSYSFILVSILVVFTRNNAIYMYLVLSFFTIITFRKQLKAIIPMLIIVFGTYLVTKGPVYKALNVQTSSSAEYIAIPLQQIGRMAYKNIKFTTEEENKINKLIPVETLKEVYNPDIVDPIKFHKNYDAAEFEKDKLGYLKLWSSLCIKHPKTAVEAYLISTIGYWYPGTEGFVTTMDIENNSLGIKNSSIIPQGIRNYTSKIQSIRIPLLGFSYCIGFCIWIIGVTAYLIYKKYNRRQLYFIAPVFGVWLTMLIATPVASEFRYVYCAYLCLPIFISTLFFQKNK